MEIIHIYNYFYRMQIKVLVNWHIHIRDTGWMHTFKRDGNWSLVLMAQRVEMLLHQEYL